MTESDAIVHFLSRALTSRRRDRFVGFVSKSMTRDKFLNSLWHDLIDEFDPRFVVPSLPN